MELRYKICILFVILSSSGIIMGSNKSDINGKNAVEKVLPIIVTTWSTKGFIKATNTAWNYLQKTGNRLGAIVEGCTACEKLQCDTTVGFGGSPDESGETTLEAMLMDGPGHRVGAVGDLRRVKNASKVAYAIMNYTKHSLLVGESATKFALEMGFPEEKLGTDFSKNIYNSWLNNRCQPNYRTLIKNVVPDPHQNCGPYRRNKKTNQTHAMIKGSTTNHDTIGMVIVDANGHISVGTSTNGASHKIPGRVGDSPLVGAGAYVDNDVGGASATGDGDVMLRFLPSYQTVESMRQGISPQKASVLAILRIRRQYRNFMGAIIAANKTGHYGAACNGMDSFTYCVFNGNIDKVQLITTECVHDA